MFGCASARVRSTRGFGFTSYWYWWNWFGTIVSRHGCGGGGSTNGAVRCASCALNGCSSNTSHHPTPDHPVLVPVRCTSCALNGCSSNTSHHPTPDHPVLVPVRCTSCALNGCSSNTSHHPTPKHPVLVLVAHGDRVLQVQYDKDQNMLEDVVADSGFPRGRANPKGGGGGGLRQPIIRPNFPGKRRELGRERGAHVRNLSMWICH